MIASSDPGWRTCWPSAARTSSCWRSSAPPSARCSASRCAAVWLVVLGLIAVYVPLTGAGASIQRAGVMGAAGVVAALAGRPASRWYALLLAVAGDACDQSPRRGRHRLAAQLRGGARDPAASARRSSRLLAGPDARPRQRRVLAEAAALTISATLATAPLTSFHFETLSVVALPANLLAVPAEAPVMWAGMLAAAVGQVGWLPVAPLTGLAGLLAGYIDQVAAWTAGPSWAQVDLGVGGLVALGAVYLALRRRACLRSALGAAARRPASLARCHRRRPRGRAARAHAWSPARADRRGGGVAIASPAVGRSAAALAPGELRVDVLDVGQGDAILLRPPGGAPVLVDAGPPAMPTCRAPSPTSASMSSARSSSPIRTSTTSAAPPACSRACRTSTQVLYARLDRNTRAAVRSRPAPTSIESRRAPPCCSRPLRLDVLWPPRDAARPRAAGPAQRALPRSARALAWLPNAAHRRCRG